MKRLIDIFRKKKVVIRNRLMYWQLDFMARAIKSRLDIGKVVVLIGVVGTGKSVLAWKVLPKALPFGGIIPFGMDVIGDEVHGYDPDSIIRQRNAVIAAGGRVIFTGQRWRDIERFLGGLERSQYVAFDLNKVWGRRGDDGIPQSALAVF